MKKPDFRALCLELLEAINSYHMMDGNDETPMSKRIARLMKAKAKVVGALDATTVKNNHNPD